MRFLEGEHLYSLVLAHGVMQVFGHACGIMHLFAEPCQVRTATVSPVVGSLHRTSFPAVHEATVVSSDNEYFWGQLSKPYSISEIRTLVESALAV